MKKLTIILSVLTVVIFIACSKEAEEASLRAEEPVSQPNQSQVTKLFKADFQSSINADPSIAPTACSGDGPLVIPGSYFLQGNATHLGELILQQSSLDHVSCNLSGASMQLTTVVSGRLTSSNGDQIFYTGNDVVDVTNFLTGAGPTGTIQGVWTITGGTGKFDNASGSFTINGLVDFTTTNFNAKAEGTITY